MHINNVYALRTELAKVLAGESVDRTTVRALLLAACDEIAEFEKHLYDLAEREEARELYS